MEDLLDIANSERIEYPSFMGYKVIIRATPQRVNVNVLRVMTYRDSTGYLNVIPNWVVVVKYSDSRMHISNKHNPKFIEKACWAAAAVIYGLPALIKEFNFNTLPGPIADAIIEQIEIPPLEKLLCQIQAAEIAKANLLKSKK